MRRRFLKILALAIIAGGTFCIGTVSAQETKEKVPKDGYVPTPQAAEKQAKPQTFYRVDYSIHELDHGKRTNTRNYTLKVESFGKASFRVGNRVPIETVGMKKGDATQFQYQDVGVDIDCRLEERDEHVWLHTNLGTSSVASMEPVNSLVSQPVFRNLRLEDTTDVTLGKATLVGAIDDAASDRRYEIEVTVERIK